MKRREVMVALAAAGVAVAARAQAPSAELLHAAGGDFASGPKVFSLRDVQRTKSANGMEKVNVFAGTLATGESIAMHESWSPAGLVQVPKHRILHSEVIVVIEGELEFVHDDISSRAVAGDVIYVAYGTNHAIRNAGPVMARYVVMQVGGDSR